MGVNTLIMKRFLLLMFCVSSGMLFCSENSKDKSEAKYEDLTAEEKEEHAKKTREIWKKTMVEPKKVYFEDCKRIFKNNTKQNEEKKKKKCCLK